MLSCGVPSSFAAATVASLVPSAVIGPLPIERAPKSADRHRAEAGRLCRFAGAVTVWIGPDRFYLGETFGAAQRRQAPFRHPGAGRDRSGASRGADSCTDLAPRGAPA